MCNTSECIAETLCIENDSIWKQDCPPTKLFPNNEEISKNCDNQPCSRKNSFKQVCEFPFVVCRKGSKDILLWISSFTSGYKKSPVEVLKDFYNEIRPSFFLIIMCAVLLTISIEACICLVLLIPVLLEPGFWFLFSTFIAVGFIGLRILTSKQKTKSKKKIKSKEI